ncbi:2-amino-4-hydroxy-6-hydroxymethyldihydropteridine diphosphokinase [Streptococcus phocae]|uniref:2-amino-4-hydroxy-6-hydroxymethyldihydropteridine diphosphokinase n=1 Tax=Streptococcus phocae TaxID=119224 RepID=A0A0N8FXE6_9STRE|nr:2-amino-4-hydroxy-6-hydroxymethyldihydropteridine diphosphokinase [Streptococcus phocae]KPJ22915.1 2-amino-4-hydroxy-6-hydroxymethyldihydropteridine pyrophosphokinase [Streptococcus phocae]
MTLVYLSLGSNMGDREGYLTKALEFLAALPQTKLSRQSHIYETAAWGKTDQADFLNMACQLETDLTPTELLELIQGIEERLDRVRHEKWGPRTIDIDILLFGDLSYETRVLQIPHPYLTQRAFVLIPLLEMDANLRLPGDKRLLMDYLAPLDQSDLKPYMAP